MRLAAFRVAALFACLASAAAAAAPGPAGEQRPAVSGESGARGALAEIARAQAGVRTLRARFMQVKRLSILRDELRSSGTFLLDKSNGGRVAWIVERPEAARIVVRPDGLWIDGRGVGAEEGGARSPVPFLRGFTDLVAGLSPETERTFEVRSLDGGRLRLVPRKSDLAAWVRSIEIAVDPTTKLPREIALEEPSGDASSITFSEVTANPPLDEKAFAP